MNNRMWAALLLLVCIALLLWCAERIRLPPQPEAEEAIAPLSSLQISVLDGEHHIEMELEAFLLRVLLAEVPASFELDALKAQAIAARTYTLRRILYGQKHRGSICTEPSCCLAYCTEDTYLRRTQAPQNILRMQEAITATRDTILTYGNQPIEALFHACSGGYTEDARDVWGNAYPYLVSRYSPGEEGSYCYTSEVSFTKTELETLLGVTLPGDTWFQNWEYTVGHGVASVIVGSKRFSGLELRKRLGLRSTLFSAEADGDTVHFSVHGYGHRVGLSQFGAQAMAAAGSSAEEILSHYYPGTRLQKFDNWTLGNLAKNGHGELSLLYN